jgi:tetratricopeptide (TPR) repeat protein
MNSPSQDPGQAKSKAQQRWENCYQRGCRLMRVEKNYEYAHSLFAECVVHDPGNLTYVEALLQNLRLIQPAPKRHSLLGTRPDRSLKQALASKEFTKVFQIGIDLLRADPWDTVTLCAIADACGQVHFNEVELAYLKQALDADPKDIEVNRHCARSLARMGQFDQAIACWHRIEVLRPGDKESSKMISQLQEERQKYPGGRPPIAEKASRPAMPQAIAQEVIEIAATPALGPRQSLEQAISTDPHDVSNYLELADLLFDTEKFSDAENAVLRGIAACGEHFALNSKLTDIRSLRAEHERTIAEARKVAELKLQRKPFRIPWLEGALGLAGIVLIFQLFPDSATTMWRAVDVRHWSRLTWFAANIIVVLFLCALRYRPDFIKAWRNRKQSRLLKRRARRTR